MKKGFFLAFFLAGLGFVAGQVAAPPEPGKLLRNDRAVVVASGLSDEELIVCSAAVAGVNPKAVLLLDSPKTARANREFLAAYKPGTVLAVGAIESLPDLEKRLGQKLPPPLAWERGPRPATWEAFFPKADQVVLCPPGQRRLLLHAACLAGGLEAPLVVVNGGNNLPQRLTAWKTTKIHAVGSTAGLVRDLQGVEVVPLADEEAVATAFTSQKPWKGRLRTIVLANPADLQRGLGAMSSLAPYLALAKRGTLALTNEEGTDTAAVVKVAQHRPHVHADVLLLAATLKAIPTEKRPNPVEGKDVVIEMEPLTPRHEEPFSFATGRLFHEDPALVLVQVARNRLLEGPRRPRRALVVSNPGGGLPLLETFSRHTARELKNAGFETTSWFHDEVMKEAVRKALPNQDIFLWEGHYKTLIEEFGFLAWDEPLHPALFFLQSCLALKEAEVGPVLQRGAIAVVGSSTRTYSATGGAFTLAYFDGLLYENQTLGGALRQAKNFLLTYSLLKEKRLGAKAKLKGVNVRSAWAFTLWGDPTLRLPLPERHDDSLDGVSHRVRNDRILLSLPVEGYDKVKVERYEAEMRPNARLAGLLRIGDEDENNRKLVPFVFAEVHLPDVPRGKTPTLKSRLPHRNFVFTWDRRRKTGYLLMTPQRSEQRELRFTVEWDN